MACRDCGGNGSCGCNIQSSTSITVTGAGTVGDPWTPRLELADTNPCLELTANGAGVLVQPGGGILKTSTGLRTATSAPIGLMGFSQVTAQQLTITTIVDLTGLSVTFTAVANRYYRTTFSGEINGTVANDLLIAYITDGANVSLRRGVVTNPALSLGTGYSNMTIQHVGSFSAGARTHKIRLERNFGTGSASLFASATSPAFITVEDIGGF